MPPSRDLSPPPTSSNSNTQIRPLCPSNLVTNLDPEWVQLWNEHGRLVTSSDGVTVEELRKSPEKYSFTYPTYAGPEVYSVRDWQVAVTDPAGEVAVRVYTPQGEGPFAAHVNFHGGGWVLGSLDSEAAWCRHMCNEANMVIIDVGYRLAPEYQFPIAIYDCWAAVKWVISNHVSLKVLADSVSIGGLSAGGHIAAILAHFARDGCVKLKLQLLVVPVTDLRYCPIEGDIDEATCEYESVVVLKDMPWGPAISDQWFLNCFIGTDAENRESIMSDWRITPVLGSNFSNLCPAHIITAEFDVLRDEGEVYGEMLRKAGNLVTAKRYLGVSHAFAYYNCPEKGLSKAKEYIVDTVAILKMAHGLA